MNQGTDGIDVVVFSAVFLIVFVVCIRAVKEMGFDGGPRLVLGFCVAVLSAMGVLLLMPGMGSGAGTQQHERGYYVILLPYAALGISLIALLLLMLLLKLFGRGSALPQETSGAPERRFEQLVETPKMVKPEAGKERKAQEIVRRRTQRNVQ